MEPEEIRRMQWRLLHEVMQAALRTEPYRRLYPSSPPGLQAPEDLRRLPFTDRAWFAQWPLQARLAARPKHMVRWATSGTSGRPMETAMSGEEQRYDQALFARQALALGVPRGARLVLACLDHARERTEMFVRGRPTTVVTPASATALAEEVRREAHIVLLGWPSVLLEMADVLAHHPVRCVLTFAEVVDEQIRSELQAAFGVSPHDLYASAEGRWISWTCPSGSGYHINADAVIVEIVGEDDEPVPPGETGEVVITNLWNRTTPFVRYRTGDLAALVPGPCRCGITLPLMDQVGGRTVDWIVTRDGRRLSPWRFTLVDPAIGDWVGAAVQYRVIQREVDDFLVQVRWRDGRRDDLVGRIEALYSSMMGYPVGVHVADVEEIPRSGSWKFRLVESRVDRTRSMPMQQLRG